MKPHESSYLLGTPLPEICRPRNMAIVRFRETRRSRSLKVIGLAVMTVGILIPSSGQNVVNCASGFASRGTCGVAVTGSTGEKFQLTASAGSVYGSKVDIIPAGQTHVGSGLIYQSPVNTQAFASTFTFIPNGWNIAFILENNTNTDAGAAGPAFSSGAGCEGGFFQGYDANDTPPNNIFAVELDSFSPLTVRGSFTYSSVQIYRSGQSPCLPSNRAPNYAPIAKISTSPVNLTTGARGTTTGDTYSVTVTYDGAKFAINMYDVTAGGSCPGVNCFNHTWNNVDIPSLVGSNTAYVGFTGSTNQASTYPLYLNSFSYTVKSPE